MVPTRHRIGRLLVVALVPALMVVLPSTALAAQPTPPELPSASITSTTNGKTGTATIAWHAPSSTGGYPMQAYTITVTPPITGSPHSTDGTTLSYQMAGFTLGVNYSVSITATNTNGETSTPTIVNFKAQARPNAPTNVTASFVGMTSGHANMRVSWKGPVYNGGAAITEYTVTLTPSGRTCTAAAPHGTCTVTGVDPGSHQHAAVTAKNLVGLSPAGGVDFTVPTIPGAPKALVATVLSWQGATATVELKWTAPSSNGGSGITGYAATVSPGTSKTTASNVLTCQFVGLQPGPYIFSVLAKNAVGSGAATQIPFVVPAAPTAPPTATPTPTPTPTATPTPEETVEPTPEMTETPAPTPVAPGPDNGSGGGTDPLLLLIAGLVGAVAASMVGGMLWFMRSRSEAQGISGLREVNLPPK